MNIDLVSLVSRFLTPDMIARFAATLGLDRSVVGKLIAGALPTVLAGLGNAAATPGGAKRISEMVSQQDPGLLDSLVGSIGGSGQQAMLSKGSQMLGSLIGGDGVSAIAGVLGSHAGADSRAASSVMGLIGPAVLGVVGQQDPKTWMEPGGIASLFAGQKDAIAAAMPAGLAGALGAAGLSNVLGQGLAGSLRGAVAGAAGAAQGMAQSAAGAAQGMAQSAAHAAGSAAASARDAAAGAADAARRGAGQAAQSVSGAADKAAAQARQAASSGLPSWVWIVAVALAAALAWWAFSGRSVEQAATSAKQTAQNAAGQAAQSASNAANQAAQTAANAAGQAAQGAAEAGKQASAALAALTASLSSVTDAASANAALPKLREAAGQVDKLGALVNGLPADAKKTIAGPIAAALPSLRQLIEKVLAMAGVGDVLRPVVAPMLDKLDALAKA